MDPWPISKQAPDSQPHKIINKPSINNKMSCFTPTSTSEVSAASTSTSESSDNPDMETFITDIISNVTMDDHSVCGNCEEGASAFSKCIDCSEMLCDTCVRAHKRVRLTKDHRISHFNNRPPPNIFQAPLNITGSLGSTSPASTNSPPLTMSYIGICENHREPHRLFCQTCHAPSCRECLMEEHTNHEVVYIEDVVEHAKDANMKLARESRQAILKIREAIDSVQRMNESIEIRSHQASNEVRTIFRRLIAALEERETDLLKKIDHTRQFKGKMLITQQESLRIALAKLARTSDLLTDAIESQNAFDLVCGNEKAESELKMIRPLSGELVPCEDDNIMFQPPDSGFLRAIAQMGNISPSVNGRVFRPIAKNSLFTCNMPSFTPQGSYPGAPTSVYTDELEYNAVGFPSLHLKNRPIFGANNMVTVRETGPIPSITFGKEGEGDGDLCRPWGVCCNSLNQILVADRSNNRIQVFSTSGVFLFKFGKQGSAPGNFDRPAGIAVNSQNDIVVADKDNHRVQVFKNDGTFILAFGEKGIRNGQFNYPWDVACNSMNQIVVSDTRNHRVQLFNSDGKFINKYGFEGNAQLWKHFDSPRGVAFTPHNAVIVTDFNNHRLVVIDPTFTNAQFLGQEGSSFKQFLRPQGLICDDEGRIIVADSRNHRIQVFERNGAFLFKVGQLGKNPGDMDRPSGIALTPDGRIVVIDFGNNRVQIF